MKTREEPRFNFKASDELVAIFFRNYALHTDFYQQALQSVENDGDGFLGIFLKELATIITDQLEAALNEITECLFEAKETSVAFSFQGAVVPPILERLPEFIPFNAKDTEEFATCLLKDLAAQIPDGSLVGPFSALTIDAAGDIKLELTSLSRALKAGSESARRPAPLLKGLPSRRTRALN